MDRYEILPTDGIVDIENKTRARTFDLADSDGMPGAVAEAVAQRLALALRRAEEAVARLKGEKEAYEALAVRRRHEAEAELARAAEEER